MTHEEYLKKVVEASKAADAYYLQDDPIMSDAEYDKLMQDIRKYEDEHPSDISTDSPSKRVARSYVKEGLGRTVHAVPMLSIKDVLNIDEVKTFYDKALKAYDTAYKTSSERTPFYGPFAVEQKIDGLSVTVTFKKGKFVLAETRGDGYVGEDVTKNFKRINCRPAKEGLPPSVEATGIYSRAFPLSREEFFVPDELVVRGEVYVTKAAFKTLNKGREAEGLKPYGNERTAAAAMLRSTTLPATETPATALSHLRFRAFSLERIVVEGVGDLLDPSVRCSPEALARFPSGDIRYFAFHSFALDFLDSFKFAVTEPVLCSSFEYLKDAVEQIGRERAVNPSPIDGAVVKINNIDVRRLYKDTEKFHTWEIAYKYPQEEHTAVILGIDLQISRLGKLTPVAKITPVEIGGTTIQSVNLFNQEYINKRFIDVGDTVYVRKAAEIIPEITSVAKKKSDDSPTSTYKIEGQRCPYCGSDIVTFAAVTASTTESYCGRYRRYRGYIPTHGCPGANRKQLEYWASRECLDIRGLSTKTIDKLCDAKLLDDKCNSLPIVVQLYLLENDCRLKKDDHSTASYDALVKTVGQKTADKLLVQIADSKAAPVERVFRGVGISGIGPTAIRSLLHVFPDLTEVDFTRFSPGEKEEMIQLLMKEPNIGLDAADTIVRFFGNQAAVRMVFWLAACGVNMSITGEKHYDAASIEEAAKLATAYAKPTDE